MEAIAVNALLWAVALAATVWILVPAIAFALCLGGIRTEILPDVGPPPVAGGEPVFGARLAEFAALGFREVARTVTHIRFPFPTHWRWRSLETTRWLVSPDGRTHATLYRLARSEPARVSCMAIFDDGSVFRTSCPGVSGAIPQLPKYRRVDVRGASAGDLVAQH